MIDVDGVLREIALRTSRRTLLAKAGRALVGGALLTFVRAETAQAVFCSACDGTLYCDGTASCGGQANAGSTCCQGPDTVFPACNPRFDLGGTWCGGSPEAWSNSSCESHGWTTGWLWTCCSLDRETGLHYMATCQDCCNGSTTVCTKRTVTGTC